MRPIATDTADFPSLRRDGCIYVDKTDWKWEKHPVIHFEFNDVDASSVEGFEKSFAEHVQSRLWAAGCLPDAGTTFSTA